LHSKVLEEIRVCGTSQGFAQFCPVFELNREKNREQIHDPGQRLQIRP